MCIAKSIDVVYRRRLLTLFPRCSAFFHPRKFFRPQLTLFTAIFDISIALLRTRISTIEQGEARLVLGEGKTTSSSLSLANR